jgi:CubicO group peptidase (beta-lactamase class C family)
MPGMVRGWRVLAAFLALCLGGCAPPPPPTPALADQLELAALSLSVDAGEHGDIAAILVSQSGQTVFEDYFGRHDPDSLVDMRSVGKSLTALAVGAAIDSGALESVNQPVMPLFEDRVPHRHDTPAKQAITVRDLLTMRSALDCNDWDPASPGNEERMYRRRDWTDFVLNLPVDPQASEASGGAARFSYCTAGVFLLGQVVENEAGLAFDEFVETRILEPIGVREVAWRRSPSGEVQSGGQLGMRARDAERIGRLVLNRGSWEGRSIVPRAWIEEMLTPVSSPVAGLRYGYLWWLAGADPDRNRAPIAMMIGNGGNIVAVAPDFDAVIVIQATNYNRPDALQTSLDLLAEAILPAVSDE